MTAYKNILFVLVVNNKVIISWLIAYADISSRLYSMPISFSYVNWILVGTIRRYNDPNNGTQSIFAQPVSINQFKCYLDWISNSLGNNISFIGIGY